MAQQALVAYFDQLKKNANQGSRVDSGTDELGLAFLIDDDLAAILNELEPSRSPHRRQLPGTEYYVEHHPELLPRVKPATGLQSRIERLERDGDAASQAALPRLLGRAQDVAEPVPRGPDHRLGLVG